MISVCIATYNGARYLEQQLRSILPQLTASDEVIVSDDGSSDGTPQLVERVYRKYKHELAEVADLGQGKKAPALHILAGPAAGSPANNFAYALGQAKGDYIFLSDQDDVWMDDKVVTCVTALQEADCVLTDCTLCDGDLNEIAPSFFRQHGTKRSRLYNLFVRNGYVGGCLAFRRNVLQKALPFPPSVPMHDIWIGNIAAFGFRLVFIDKAKSLFRRHDHTASTTAAPSDKSIAARLTLRLRVAFQLFQRLVLARRAVSNVSKA